MTHRQYLGWQAFLYQTLGEPDRHDLYLMQLTHEVRFSQARKPQRFLAKDYLLQLPQPKPQTPQGRRQEVEARIQVAIGSVGGKVQRRYKTKDGTPCDEHGNPLPN